MTVANETALAGGGTVTSGLDYTIFDATIPNLNGKVVTAAAGSTTATALLSTLSFTGTVAPTNVAARGHGCWSSCGESGSQEPFDVN